MSKALYNCGSALKVLVMCDLRNRSMEWDIPDDHGAADRERARVGDGYDESLNINAKLHVFIENLVKIFVVCFSSGISFWGLWHFFGQQL
jgi:hypothetical protein